MFDEHEPAEFELTPDLTAMERQLARLTPAAPRIDRDRLMFAAGQAAERAASEPSPSPSLQGRGIKTAATLRVAGPRRWFWPAATATMTAATLLLATMLVWQRAAQPIAMQPPTPPEPTTTVAAPPAQSVETAASATPAASQSESFGWPMASPPTTGYLGLRYIALTRGVGELETHDLTANSTQDTSIESRATQRDLLRELLPSANRAAPPRS